ncbi:MAG: HAMP domain-containing histidine kinase [Treponema sp.]|nr:HAMP domain-containing histidine kinase [Candidatus Treponema equifaecale]
MKVIQQLRIKVILSILTVQLVFFTTIFAAVNIALVNREEKSATDFLQMLAENEGHRTPANSRTQIASYYAQELLLNTQDEASTENDDLRNYFAVNVSHEGVINEIIQDFPLNYTDQEISQLILRILQNDDTSGLVMGFHYLIVPAQYGNSLVCIINRKSELASIHQMQLYSTLAFFVCIVVSFLMALLFSNFTVKQAALAFKTQKQFIADAGHELKTPIAVIGANIDVLEADEKLAGNKFFQYIKQENQRMGELVKDLLYLAKDDAEKLEVIFSDFDFSNAVENAVLPFEVMAFESGMTLNLDIEPEIICNGEERYLKQLFVILVDNAIKNSDRGAEITVKAYTENQKIIYKVRNTGEGISKDDLQKIFLRFYRSDYSRARKTGGYGLGLSIAQTIARNHNGTLVADSVQGEWAEFTLTLPRKIKKS